MLSNLNTMISKNHCNVLVNINGNTADTLLEGWLEVYVASLKLVDALKAASPHGRNYQTLGDEQRVLAMVRDEQMMRLMRQFASDVADYAQNSGVFISEQSPSVRDKFPK